MAQWPTLITNPADDLLFAVLARRLLERAGRILLAEDLQVALRRYYRCAVVRPRQLSGEAGLVWYVYRDGRWVPSGGSGAGPAIGRLEIRTGAPD